MPLTPRLAIAKEFLAEYAKLEKPVQRAVQGAIEKFQHPGHPGQHLEGVTHARDQRIRTIRIDRFWRGVVLAPESGDLYCLLRVLPHDDAYKYAVSHRFSVNEQLGVLESRDESQLETIEPALRRAAESAPKRLFEGVKDTDLKRLGIDEQVLPVIRLLTREAHLDALQHLLPARQYDALVALASGMLVEEAWAEISKNLVDHAAPAEVDSDDLTTAINRTPGEVRFVAGLDELTTILEYPFDVWRVFLHPMQERIARRPSWNGPAMVTGGAGTGKTVTALHRAAFLAERVTEGDDARILLTTFSKPLQQALGDQLSRLIDDPAVRERVDVLTTDAVAARVVREEIGRAPTVISGRALESAWDQWARELKSDRSGRFLIDEWEQVVLAQDLSSEEEYLSCKRTGRRERLRTTDRPQVWATIDAVRKRMRDNNEWSFLQIAHEAAEILRKRGDHVYRHVIVDEAQDLHPAQWRLLQAVAPRRATDNLFIAGDPHQRIYQHDVSLQSLEIDVRGRSRRLTVSYRTTQEILSWAVSILDLGPTPVKGMDGQYDRLEGYESPMHGRRPVVRRFPDREAELDALSEQVRTWLSDGIEPEAIGVAVRVTRLGQQAKDRLRNVGVTSVSPTASGAGVRVGTMHAMKGLEFSCMAIVGAEESLVPHPAAVTPAEIDKVAHDQDKQRERCLLFVACTRARDRLYVSHAGAPSPFLPR